jgi:soluble lytic murein transglycosylase-like protein
VTPEPRWRHLLYAASVCYGAGAWGTGIRYAWLAYGDVPEADSSARWSVVPWLYPPAHAGLFAPAGVWNDSTALLYAVTWQESRFDSLARSTSNALGLMQLKLPTAREQARLMRLPLPREKDLFRPARNVELGAGYLDRIARVYGGRTTMALAAYNARPAGAKPWSRLPSPGGEALACELITYGQTHHYVKTVLGAWQAARALRPRVE